LIERGTVFQNEFFAAKSPAKEIRAIFVLI
jgi:hypothetical protein